MRKRSEVVRGAEFGRLTIIKRINLKKGRRHLYKAKCRCKCGNIHICLVDSLLNDGTKSCGCLSSEMTTDRNLRTAKFGGFSVDPRFMLTFSSWQAMMTRCRNENSTAYEPYGGSGIKVCGFLAETPKNLADLIGRRPNKGFTLDRYPKYNGHYSCGSCEECKANGWTKNVRWATRKEQNRNGSRNAYLTAFGETVTKSTWTEITGLSWGVITHRLRQGWTPEDAVSIPTLPPGKASCLYRTSSGSGTPSV